MTEYAYKTANAFIGKKIRALELDESHVLLTCADGTRLEYEMSVDGEPFCCWTAMLPNGRIVTT